jgi:predicted ATPase/DNA-binding SARP family transcriptional activator
MEFKILGPLEISDGGRPRALGGLKPRAVLAMLLLHANETVSAQRLAMGLWGDDVAGDAVRTVQVHVSRLRKALGSSAKLESTLGGYMLHVGSGELDLWRFEELVVEGRDQLDAGDPERAATALHEALDLWRGPALADLAAAPFAAAEIARLEEQRLAAVEMRVEADLARGRHAELVGELQKLTDAHPVRERLHAQLMLALYRSGRQAEALDAYRRAHRYLADELGLEPGAELRSLEAEILGQEPSLDLPEPTATSGLPAREPLLGRDDDVAAVIGLLEREGAQLVTVTGVGGVGKTSLAIEVAHRIAAGAAFVGLASLTHADEVPGTALRALGGTVEPGESATDALCRLLASRPRLVVLDNFEHVTGAATLLSELIDAAPGVKLLVTSRTALDLRREQRYSLDPLDLPASATPADVADAPASALFIARAMARDPALRLTADAAAAIAELCRRLDALPLAIELAAARASVLSPQEIAGRLDSTLGDLGQGPRDAPARQRTLRATLDWSHDLLDDDERAAFARLSVFAGGCDAEAAERVADAPLELLDRLVAKSMLTRRRGPDGTTRLVMLEPVREYAAERFAERTDRAEVEQRHGRYYVELAEAAHAGIMGADQVSCGLRIDAEAANLRRTLERARDSGDAEAVLRVMVGLDEWWFSRMRWAEGRAWVRWALDRADESVPPELRAAGWQALGYLLWPEQDFEGTLAAADAAWKLASAAGDVEGLAWCQILRTQTYLALGDENAARAAAVDAVRLAKGLDEQARAYALQVLAVTTEDWTELRVAADRAAAAMERAGDLRGLARLWEEVGFEALADGRIDEAGELLERAIEVGRWLDGPADAATRLMHYGVVAVELGDDDAGRRRISAALEVFRARGIRALLSEALLALAVLAARDGDVARAGRLVGAAAAARPGHRVDPVEERLQAAAVAIAGDSQGEWEQAVAGGRELGWDESIELGLQATVRGTQAH